MTKIREWPVYRPRRTLDDVTDWCPTRGHVRPAVVEPASHVDRYPIVVFTPGQPPFDQAKRVTA